MERATEARKVADLAACAAWNIRMKRLWRPGAAIAIARRRAQRRLLEVSCNGCSTHNAVELTVIRRPRGNANLATGGAHADHLGRLRRSKVTTKDDGEPWYPGDHRDRN